MEKTQVLCEDTGKNAAKLSFLLHILTVLVMSVVAYAFRIDLIQILQIIVLEEIILIGLLYFIKKNYNHILFDSQNVYILTAAYLSSIVFVLLTFKYQTYNFWLIGGILVALLIDVNLGIVINFIFTFLISFVTGFITGFDFNQLVIGIVLGTIMCLFINCLSEIRKSIYVVLISCSTNITLIFALNKFNFDAIDKYYLFYSVLSTILIMVTAFFCFRILDKIFDKKKTPKNKEDVFERETGEILKNGETLTEETNSKEQKNAEDVEDVEEKDAVKKELKEKEIAKKEIAKKEIAKKEIAKKEEDQKFTEDSENSQWTQDKTDETDIQASNGDLEELQAKMQEEIRKLTEEKFRLRNQSEHKDEITGNRDDFGVGQDREGKTDMRLQQDQNMLDSKTDQTAESEVAATSETKDQNSSDTKEVTRSRNKRRNSRKKKLAAKKLDTSIAAKEENLEDDRTMDSVDGQAEQMEEIRLQNRILENKMLEAIMKDEYMLKIKLKEYSESIYNYSVSISKLSGKAAKRIEKNQLLAETGGFYHKIGRIISKDYVNAGIKIATKCNFPESVIHIIKEHNSKTENPSSPEAAIVMLSDTITSTVEFMDQNKNRKPIPKNKLIDTIFNARLTKGSFDECGLTIVELKKLKEFYMEEFFKG